MFRLVQEVYMTEQEQTVTKTKCLLQGNKLALVICTKKDTYTYLYRMYKKEREGARDRLLVNEVDSNSRILSISSRNAKTLITLTLSINIHSFMYTPCSQTHMRMTEKKILQHNQVKRIYSLAHEHTHTHNMTRKKRIE